MNQPQIIKCRDIKSSCTARQFRDGSYGPARYMPYYYSSIGDILNRLKLSWLVFTGKCDVLDWEEQE